MNPVSFAPPPTFGPLAGVSSSQSVAPTGAPDFAALLADAVGSVNEHAQSADAVSTRALLGEDITQAEVFSAVKKADLSLRMLISVRNKLLEGWKELQSIPV